ncbi:MAG: bifunctional heptose 7-phosphate kinase/heptose 1-phosphate adenyltransferase [Armatimonadota bacterium]
MTPQRAQELLTRSAGRRVLLIGDLMMDEWVFGSVKRISPEAPIPVVNMPLTPDARADKPGGAGNAAAILLTLGASVAVVGVIGEDDFGRRLRDDLAARGADVSGVVTDSSRPTTHKLRILAGRQQLLRIDTESDLPFDTAVSRHLLDSIRRLVTDAEVVLVSDYAKGVVSRESLPADVIEQTRAARIPFCADPKPANIDVFHHASLVSPNEAEALEAGRRGVEEEKRRGGEEEARAFSGPQSPISLPSSIAAAGRSLKHRLDCDAVFITRGANGIAAFAGEDVTCVPAIASAGDVGDGTGCGDAVSAVSALALAAGASYLEAAELANAAGGVVSRFVGVHNPTAAEIMAGLGSNECRPKK